MSSKGLYGLTNPQKSIWMTEQFYKGTNINNIVGYLKISDKANFEALEKAFEIYPDVKVIMLAHLYGTIGKIDKTSSFNFYHSTFQ